MYTLTDVDNEMAHVNILINECNRRRRWLEVQKVKFGAGVEPQVVNEIEDIANELKKLNHKRSMLSSATLLFLSMKTQMAMYESATRRINEILKLLPPNALIYTPPYLSPLPELSELESIGLDEEYLQMCAKKEEISTRISEIERELLPLLEEYRKL